MNRLRFGLAATLLIVVGCASAHHTDRQEALQPRVAHIVVCWLKTPGDEIARQRLIDESRNFVGDVPGLITVSAGRSLASTRPTVDSSFDVTMVMTFADRQALEDYQTSARHQQATRDVLRPLVQRYIIYDVIDDAPRGR